MRTSCSTSSMSRSSSPRVRAACRTRPPNRSSTRSRALAADADGGVASASAASDAAGVRRGKPCSTDTWAGCGLRTVVKVPRGPAEREGVCQSLRISASSARTLSSDRAERLELPLSYRLNDQIPRQPNRCCPWHTDAGIDRLWRRR